MSNFDGKHGEIANQSGVVIQTTHDIKDMVNRMRVNEDTSYIYPGAVRTLDTATVRVNINDLVFRAGTSKAPRQNLLNNAIEVTSNLNGFAINKKRVKGFVKDVNNPTEEEKLQAISESIRFIGQALGATVPNPENEEDQKLQFTTRVQGTGHILNTGSAQLSPGDTLYWDLFTSEEIKSDAFKKRLTRFGFGAKTVPLKTVPMSAAHSGFNTAITRALGAPDTLKKSSVDRFGSGVADALLYAFYIGKGGLGTTGKDFEEWKKDPKIIDAAYKLISKIPDEYNKYIEGLVPAFTYFQEDLKRREVGKVLSYAAPGKGVDVLFGSS
jgi:hypothetical protein